MENLPAKIRINVSQAEIEVEGSEEFVEKHIEKLRSYLQLFDSETIPTIRKTQSVEMKGMDLIKKSSTENEKHTPKTVHDLPVSFGEWIHKLPSAATDAIKVIFAGYYCQKGSENNFFHTACINKLLMDHAIKVSNSSTTLRRLISAKKVFQVGKNEGLITYRLTRETENEIISLLKN